MIDFVLAGLGLAALIGLATAGYEARRRQRAMARQHAAQQVLETLVQDIQGLVLNLQVLLGELRPDDGLRLRFERMLDDIELVLSAAAAIPVAEHAAPDA